MSRVRQREPKDITDVQNQTLHHPDVAFAAPSPHHQACWIVHSAMPDPCCSVTQGRHFLQLLSVLTCHEPSRTHCRTVLLWLITLPRPRQTARRERAQVSRGPNHIWVMG